MSLRGCSTHSDNLRLREISWDLGRKEVKENLEKEVMREGKERYATTHGKYSASPELGEVKSAIQVLRGFIHLESKVTALWF